MNDSSPELVNEPADVARFSPADMAERTDTAGSSPADTAEPSDSAGAPDLSTGDAQVDAALQRLAELDNRDLDQHAEIYDDIHRSLGSVLDSTSEGRQSRP